jgi:WD40 repeat protein
MNTARFWTVLFGLSIFLMWGQLAEAAKPGGAGGGGGARTPPNPDIWYLSDHGSTDALSQVAMRGAVLATDGLSGTDISLAKSKAGRQASAIAWSPDGTKAAWFEQGLGMVSTPVSIMVGTPGGRAVAVYSSTPDVIPHASPGTDGLAWGPDCSDPTQSILAFAAQAPIGLSRIYGVRFKAGKAQPPELLAEWTLSGDGRISTWAYAFSPHGQYLAFAGRGDDSTFGVWLLSMCGTRRVQTKLLSFAEIGGYSAGGPPVSSLDWSPNGDRLALSVTTSPDSYYTWRDLKVVYLGYQFSGGAEQVFSHSVAVLVDLPDLNYPVASSEHSPQWGPSAPGETCQRIAFSQSSDAGRALFLLDVGTDGNPAGCSIETPLALPSNSPRALDWR